MSGPLVRQGFELIFVCANGEADFASYCTFVRSEAVELELDSPQS